MYEDSAVELRAFEPGSRVFCIASAGCTAFDLAAAGHDVTAADVNPAQIDYVRRRLAGHPPERGRADRALERLRRLARLVGWSGETLDRFCAFDATDEQLAFWRRRLDTLRFRSALAATFSQARLRRAYRAPFVEVLPPRFDLVLRQRLERGFGRHPNAENPYAQALLLGRRRAVTPAPVSLAVADAVEFLEQSAPGSFAGLSLSNILDGADEAYAERLFRAVRRAATPGAVVILRSFAEPRTPEEAERAGDDRGLFWGSVRIDHV